MVTGNRPVGSSPASEPSTREPPASRGGRRPRQRRAVQTRRRILQAALAEYERVGVQEARVEDIVAAAGVSWSTFFDYFPRKEDVLQEAGAERAAAFGAAIDEALRRGDMPVHAVFVKALRAARDVGPRSELVRSALVREIVSNPGRMTVFLADRGQASWGELTSRLLAEGQRRGELRDDYPPRALASVLLQAWAMSANRETTLGRPPGDWAGPSSSLGELAVEICFAGMRPRER